MTSIGTLSALPRDTLIASCDFLSLKEFARRAVKVCKAFRGLTDDVFKQFMNTRTHIGDDVLEVRNFARWTLREGMERNITRILDDVPRLRSLSLFTPVFFMSKTVIQEALASARAGELTQLSISASCYGTSVDDTVVKEIAGRCLQLTDLSLHHSTGLTDAGTAPLAQLKQLRSVSFHCSYTVSTETLRMLAELPALTEVCLSDCRNVRPEGMEVLLTSKTLTTLDVGGDCSGGHHGQVALADVIAEHGKRLTELRMMRAYYREDKLVDIATKCTQLVVMNLAEYQRVYMRDPKTFTEELQKARPGLKVIFNSY